MLVRDQFTRALIKRKYAGVPTDGEYRFKVIANTVRWRDHRFDWGELGYDGSEPPRIRILVTAIVNSESFQRGHLASTKSKRINPPPSRFVVTFKKVMNLPLNGQTDRVVPKNESCEKYFQSTFPKTR